VSIEVKNKARVLDKYYYSGSPETVAQGSGVQDEVE